MKIAIIIPRIDISQGGPTFTIINMCKALTKHNIDVTLISTTHPYNFRPEEIPHLKYKFFNKSFPQRFDNSNGIIKYLNEHNFDIYHIHNLWNITSTRVMKLAVKKKIPFIITPHGMISAWHKNILSIKKFMYFILFDKHTIHKAKYVHFLTQEEFDKSKNKIIFQNHFVLPNGVWIGKKSNNLNSFKTKLGLDNKKIILFLGRLNKIKRLDLQVDALKIISKEYNNIKWIFAGPDDGYEKILKKKLSGISNQFYLITGNLDNELKKMVLSSADIYCHTSDHEGSSNSILEALSFGIPLVITKGCNLPDVEKYHAGFVVDPDPNIIGERIRYLLSRNRDENMLEYGKNGINLIKASYNWDSIASQIINCYEKALVEK